MKPGRTRETLHKMGVLHGSVANRNLVVGTSLNGQRGIFLIDFQRARRGETWNEREYKLEMNELIFGLRWHQKQHNVSKASLEKSKS